MEAGDGLPSHWEVLHYGVQQRLRVRRLWRRQLPVDHSDHYPALLLLRRRELGRLRLWWLWLQQRLREQLLLSQHRMRAGDFPARNEKIVFF